MWLFGMRFHMVYPECFLGLKCFVTIGTKFSNYKACLILWPCAFLDLFVERNSYHTHHTRKGKSLRADDIGGASMYP